MFTHPVSCHHPDPSREAFSGHVGEDPWVTLLHITQMQFSGGEPSSAVSVFSCINFTGERTMCILFSCSSSEPVMGPNTACSVGIRGLLSWLSGKESTHQCRRLVFDPWSGKIPRAAEQLSPGATIYWACARVWELKLPSPRAHSPRAKPLQWEACAPHLESSACSLQLKSVSSNKDPAQPK